MKFQLIKIIIFAFFALLAAILSSCPDSFNGSSGKSTQNGKDEDEDNRGNTAEARLLGKVVILQAYGTGNKNDGGVSHSFIELYNKSDKDADLSGHYLQYSPGGTGWKTLNLNGQVIPAGCSFLIIGEKMNELNTIAGIGLLQLNPEHADMIWHDELKELQIDNNMYKIFLVESEEPVTYVNPFDINADRTGVKAKGYVDLLGVNDTDLTKAIDAFETGDLKNPNAKAPYLSSKGKSARRIVLNDTDDNGDDFERIEWRAGQSESVSAEAFKALRPRSSKDGKWNPVYPRASLGSGAVINSLLIAGKTANIGSPAESYNDISNPGEVTISNLTAGSAVVTAGASAGAAVKTAKVSGNEEPDWENLFSYSFDDGDFLIIEVISRDGRARNYYRIAVNVTHEDYYTVSGTVTLHLNSAYTQKNIAIEAHANQNGTSLISRADVNQAEMTWSLPVPQNKEVWLKVIVTDETGYTFGKVVTSGAQAYSSDTEDVVLALSGFVPPQLLTFTLINAGVNNLGVKKNKTGIIDQATGIITMPPESCMTISTSVILPFHKLAASFEVSHGSKLFVDNVEQISGVTANNYYRPVTFTVVAPDNTRKTYTVAGASETSVAGTTTFQTQGFGVINLTTVNNIGLPEGINIGKLNIVWNPTGKYEYIGPEGRSLEGGVDVKAHGNYSVRNDNVKSIGLKLNNPAGFDYFNYKTGKFEVLPPHKRWVLLAHPYDGSRIKTTVGYEMGRRVLDKMGWQPHADFVHVFLNGVYKGLYILSEVIKVDRGRMNIAPEAGLSSPDGGWVAEMNNYWWYVNDIMNGNDAYIFDELYNFMTSHQNPVQYPVEDRSGYDGPPYRIKQQGVVWSWSAPDENLGWYYPDPPPGNGNLSYRSNNNFPRKGIVLHAKLTDGADYNRRSRQISEWIVPDDFGAPNGMGTPAMSPAGVFGQNNGGVFGARTLADVFPNHERSVFVKMAKFIQDAEDAIYSHDYGNNGAGGYHDYIDIDAFIDWQIAMELAGNWELIAMNGHYMHYDPSVRKLKMGPLWDFDQSWNGNSENGAAAGYVRKVPFWYKELLGWEMTTGGASLTGRERADRKDPYYIMRLKMRWAEVKGKINAELDPYIDAQYKRFGRLSGYSGTLVVRSDTLKSIIANRVNQVDAVINRY